jgi:hypothetical protein
MPPSEWKKRYQKEASPEQQAKFAAATSGEGQTNAQKTHS